MSYARSREPAWFLGIESAPQLCDTDVKTTMHTWKAFQVEWPTINFEFALFVDLENEWRETKRSCGSHFNTRRVHYVQEMVGCTNWTCPWRICYNYAN